MGFFFVSYVFFLFLLLCLTVRICKIYFVFYINMIQDFFTSVFYLKPYLYICIFAHIFDLLYCYLWIYTIFEYYFS